MINDTERLHRMVSAFRVMGAYAAAFVELVGEKVFMDLLCENAFVDLVLAQGKEIGLREGHQKGLQKPLQKARKEARRAIIRILERRFTGELTPSRARRIRRRLGAIEDSGRLADLAVEAAVCQSLEEFEGTVSAS